VTAVLLTVPVDQKPRGGAPIRQHDRKCRVAPNLAATQQADIQTAIAEAFRIAFLSIAAFTATGCFLALSIPLRRI
jgi:hypothetical protein